MATIIQILDRYRRPVAEINTFDMDRVELQVIQRPIPLDSLVAPKLFSTWVHTYEQKMIPQHPDTPIEICSACGGTGRIRR